MPEGFLKKAAMAKSGIHKGLRENMRINIYVVISRQARWPKNCEGKAMNEASVLVQPLAPTALEEKKAMPKRREAEKGRKVFCPPFPFRQKPAAAQKL